MFIKKLICTNHRLRAAYQIIMISYHFVWTWGVSGSRANTNYEQIASWCGSWFLTHHFWISETHLTHLPQCRTYASVTWVSIGSDNVLSPDRRQAIMRTNAGILLIGPSGTRFSEIQIKIQKFSFMKVHFKMSYRYKFVRRRQKTMSYQYRKSHCGDKTVVRSSYLHNGISYTGMMTSSYWIRTHVSDHRANAN